MTDLDLLDRPPASEVPVVLALGANLGDREATLASAVARLAQTPGISVRVVSPVAETDPVGGPDQPDYLNAVLLAGSTLSPRALLRACQAVEAAHGRRRDVRWGARTLDIDLIDVTGLTADSPDLQLPHPRAAGRAFVLAPWDAADPVAQLPTADGPRSVAELLAVAPDAAGVRARPDVVLPVPRGATARFWSPAFGDRR